MSLSKDQPKPPGRSLPWRVAVVLGVANSLMACRTAPRTQAKELQPLQGSWQGEGAGGPCAITITGRTLHYRAGTNWWRTTFTLPPGGALRQLHATLADSSPPTTGVGTVVFALYQIEDDVLTLAVDDGSDQAPASFESASSRYVVKRARLP